MAVRNYSSTTPIATLVSGIAPGDTSMTLSAPASSFPPPPFTMLLSPETPSEEVVDVTAAAGSVFTIVRGVDGTVANTHGAGAEAIHGVSARDFSEANLHANATTSVHGIADTSALETASGAQAKADAAQAAAASSASAAISAHNSATTSVHGIADTSQLETVTGSQAKATAAETAANTYTDSKVPGGFVVESGSSPSVSSSWRNKTVYLTPSFLCEISVPDTVAGWQAGDRADFVFSDQNGGTAGLTYFKKGTSAMSLWYKTGLMQDWDIKSFKDPFTAASLVFLGGTEWVLIGDLA